MIKGIKYILFLQGIDYLLLAIIGLHIFAVWFKGDSLYLGGDTVYPLRPSLNMNLILYTWSDNNGGMQPTFMVHYFKWFFFFIFDKLGLPLVLIQRMYLYLNFILPGLSMYFLTSVIYSKIYPDNNGKRVACLIAALFFMFNSPIFAFGYIDTFWPYGVTPFILAFFIRGIDAAELKGKIKYGLLAALFMFGFIIVLPDYNVAVIFLLILVIYSLFYLLFDKGKVRNLLRLWTIFAGLVLSINLWATLPWLLMVSTHGTQMASSTPLTPGGSWIGEGLPLAMLRNFMLVGPLEYMAAFYFRPGEIIRVINLFFILVAFSSLLLKPKSKMVIFFALISLLAIIICVGPNPPFVDLYKWLLSSSVYLRGFRSTSPIAIFIALGYAVLIGVTISELYQRVSNKKFSQVKDYHIITKAGDLRKAAPKVFVFIVIALILANGWPMATGAYYKTPQVPAYEMHEIPSSYYELDRWLTEQGNYQDYRLLRIPDAEVYWLLRWPEKDYFGGDLTRFIFSSPTVFRYEVLTSPIVRSIYNVSVHDYDVMIKLMGLLNVKYYYIDHYADRSGVYVRGLGPALFPGPEGGYELSLNGDDYVRVPDSPSLYSNALTIEAWIRTANNPIGIEFIPVVTKKEGANEYFFGLRNGDVYAIGWNETGKIAFEVHGGMKVTDTYWHHIVFTTDGTTAKTYLDGGLQGSSNVKGKIANTSSSIYLGHDPPYLFLNGVIDEVRILNRALTAEEVVDNYREKQAILEDNVVALWDFDKGDGAIVKDGSLNGNDGTIHGAEYDQNIVPAKSVANLTRYEQSFDKLVLYSINEDYVYPRVYATSKIIPIDGAIEPALLKFLNKTDFSGDKPALFLSEQLSPQDWQFIQGLRSNEGNPEVTFERIDSTEYRVHINASKPSFLVLSTQYDKYWTASISGRELTKHLIANGYANAWYLDEVGSFDVVLKYQVQNYYHIAILISALTLVGCIYYIEKDKLTNFIKKKITQQKTQHLSQQRTN